MDVKTLVPIAIMFVVAAIVISMGAEIITNLQTNVKGGQTTSITNESVSGVTAGVTKSLINNDLTTVSNVSNSTNTFTNYTVTSLSYGQITMNDVGNVSGGIVYVDYTYYTKTAQYNATTQGLLSLNTFAENLSLIAIIIAAAIIIGIIVLYYKLD